jgi:hypothetical protein
LLPHQQHQSLEQHQISPSSRRSDNTRGSSRTYNRGTSSNSSSRRRSGRKSKATSESCNAITQAISSVNDFCRSTPPLFLNLKPVGKPTFRLQVLADTGATRSLISLSTATKHGCEIRKTTICLSAANGTKIDVSGTTSLQVVEKGQCVHTIVVVISQIKDQTIVGWKDLMAMGIISSDWPTMPRQETEGKILAADNDEEEK